MIKVRNNLVLVKIIDKAEHKVGTIVLPANNDQFAEAEVVDVGPGNVAAEGGRSDTFDLNPGQRVYLKHKELRPGPAGGTVAIDAGIRYRVGDDTFFIVAEGSIVGILAEPAGDPHLFSENN